MARESNTASSRHRRAFRGRTLRRKQPFGTRRLAVEPLEDRRLLDVGLGLFLQGTAFIDANHNSVLDSGEAYKEGATIQLFDETGSTLFAQTTTDVNGAYLFDFDSLNLGPGTYRLVEVPAPGYVNGGAQTLSQLYSASVIDASTIEVTLVDPNILTVSFDSGEYFGDELFDNLQVTVLDEVGLHGLGRLPVEVTGGATPASFGTFCVDLSQDLGLGVNKWKVLPSAAPTLSAGVPHNFERIAYLYNHYGTLPKTAWTRLDAVAFQAAISELLYDETPDFSSGDYRDIQAHSDPRYIPTHLNPQDIVNRASQFISESAGKSERAIFLEAVQQIEIGMQGILATGSYNFANVLPAAIGNYVWVDENSDGYQDAGEPGIPNVTVVLYDAQGNEAARTVTDAHGGYLFDNLAPGTYYVDVLDDTRGLENTLPAGMTQTPPSTLAGADFGNQDHGTTPISTTGFTGYRVTVGPGEENLTADFGYNWNPSDDVNSPELNPNPPASAALGDRVWVDVDGDGAQDPSEIGVEGVLVNLITPGPDGLFGTADDVVAATATTNATGNYIFDNLAPGAYVVEIDASNFASVGPLYGYAQTGDPDHFGTTGTNDNLTTTPVVLAPGDVFLNVDFGYQPPAAENNTVGDTVWFDADGDGVQDAGEPGIGGVTVMLIEDTNGNGAFDASESIIGTATTDANGNYLFQGLPDGKYIVAVNDTDNVLGELTQSGDPDGTLDNQSAVDLDSAGVSGGGVIDLLQDFGYTPPGHNPGEGLIGDTIFLDRDNNGTPDAGEGIEGVVVELYDATGTILIAATTTDENGNYYFGGLDPNGTYTVVVDTTTLPPGLSNTVDPDGPPNNNQSTIDLSNDPDGTNDGINLDQDFGYVPAENPGSIGDLAWLDTNADGFNDGPAGPDGTLGTDDDEPGIAGVTLDLYYDTNGNGVVDPGEPLVASTVTDSNGNYLFTNLPTADNGVGAVGADYVVDVTDVDGVLAGYWHSLGATATDNNSQIDPYAVSISAGAPNNLTADFGYYVEPGALGNYVWVDSNGDGLQNDGETGINGVKVTLVIDYFDVTQVTLTTVTTNDASGNPGYYSFGNLLLDEDYASGSPSGLPTTSQPAYTISVDTAQPALSGYAPTQVDVNLNGNDLEDSDNHAGVTAVPVQGLSDTQAIDPAMGEPAIASYDFGFVALEPGIELVKEADTVFVDPFGQVTYTYTLTNTGGLPLTVTDFTDDSGTPDFAADDFSPTFVGGDTNNDGLLDRNEVWTYTATRFPPLQMCQIVDGVKTPVGTQIITEVSGTGDVTATFITSRAINDNAYGTGAEPGGWNRDHEFGDLVGSDKAQFVFLDGLGNVVLDATVDYISAGGWLDVNDDGSQDPGEPVYGSGYGTLGVTGGEGRVNVGSASDVSAVTTSLSDNLNQDPAYYGFTTDSPPEPNAEWEYRMIYSVTVAGSAFETNGFGTVRVPSVHNSPSKSGYNVEDPEPCEGTVTNTATVTALADGEVVAAKDDASVVIVTGPLGAIGDFVWFDANGNGFQDSGESGVQDVTVNLSYAGPDGTFGTADDFTDVRITDANGNYLFDDLPPGDYTVTFQRPTGFGFTLQDQGSDAVDSDANRVSGTTDVVSLAAGQTNLTVDAGLIKGLVAIDIEKFVKSGASFFEGCLCAEFGKPQVITMTYTGDGDDATSHSQDAGKVVVTGDPNDATTVFIRSTDKSNPNDLGGRIYFEGLVDFDEDFQIDATLAGETKLTSTTFVHVFDASRTTLLQTVAFHTSCSQPLFLGDQFGSARLVGYLSETGTGSSIPDDPGLGEDADTPTGPTFVVGDEVVFDYVVTNIGGADFTSVKITDSDTSLVIVFVDKGDGDAILSSGETWVLTATTVASTAGQQSNLGTVTTSEDLTDSDPAYYFVQGTKFFVVDNGGSDATFQYTEGGSLVTSTNLASGNSDPRGAASNAAGDTLWVVDKDKFVYVYDASGTLQGSWKAKDISDKVQGIATDGDDIWVVEEDKDLFFYEGGAGFLSGEYTGDSKFKLDSGLGKPTGITTDGFSLWVVDKDQDKVFKYDITSGVPQFRGTWALDGANKEPSGITIDPSGGSDTIWIVDKGTDQIFAYEDATGWTDGSRAADAVFDLASGNANPEGVADPPPLAAMTARRAFEPAGSASRLSSGHMMAEVHDTLALLPSVFQSQLGLTARSALFGSILDFDLAMSPPARSFEFESIFDSDLATKYAHAWTGETASASLSRSVSTRASNVTLSDAAVDRAFTDMADIGDESENTVLYNKDANRRPRRLKHEMDIAVLYNKDANRRPRRLKHEMDIAKNSKCEI